jgi:hypothetical protein
LSSAVVMVPRKLSGLSPTSPVSPPSSACGFGGDDFSLCYGTDPSCGSGLCDDWSFGSRKSFPDWVQASSNGGFRKPSLPAFVFAFRRISEPGGDRSSIVSAGVLTANHPVESHTRLII